MNLTSLKVWKTIEINYEKHPKNYIKKFTESKITLTENCKAIIKLWPSNVDYLIKSVSLVIIDLTDIGTYRGIIFDENMLVNSNFYMIAHLISNGLQPCDLCIALSFILNNQDNKIAWKFPIYYKGNLFFICNTRSDNKNHVEIVSAMDILSNYLYPTHLVLQKTAS